MQLVHLPATATAEEAAACVTANGYVIIDEVASKAQMDRVHSELAPYIEKTRFGQNEATGRCTRRTGSLIARSPTAREMIAQPLVLEVVKRCLSSPQSFQLSLTEVISLAPGAAAQFIHRDGVCSSLADDYEAQISTLWSMTDYTEEMGATRIVPGSHRLASGLKFVVADTVPAVMSRGSILIYSGKLYHGGGENRSQSIRQAMNIDYVAGWLRQEENQYLSCPREIARELPTDLLKLMGYNTHMSFGRVGNWEDPLGLLFDKTVPLDENNLFGELVSVGKPNE